MTTNLTVPQAPVTERELDQLIWGLERYGLYPRQLAALKELRELKKVNAEKFNQHVSETNDSSWIPVSERMPDPKSELRVCVYTPTPHEDIRYRFVPASLFKAVCRDATHWRYMTAPTAPKEAK